MIPEFVIALFSVFKLVFCVSIFCHFVACAWYAIGTVGVDDLTTTWVGDLISSNATMMHRYVVSFHWAFAQFTPAPPPAGTSPTTLREEAFVVSLLIFGLVVFSAFMGSVTANLTAAKTDTMKRARQAHLFRQYVRDNRVTIELAHRILSFVRQRHHAAVRTVAEDEVEALKNLPLSLRSMLDLELFAPVIITHPLFSQLKESHGATFREVCETAFIRTVLKTGDDLIRHGTEATKMFFVCERRRTSAASFSALNSRRKLGAYGSADVLDYFPAHPVRRDDSRLHRGRSKTRPVDGVPAGCICEGEWICEVALWMTWRIGDQEESWRHTCSISARRWCEVLEMDVKTFQTAATHHDTAFSRLRAYARHFAAGIEECSENLEIWGSIREATDMVTLAFTEPVVSATPLSTSHKSIIQVHSQNFLRQILAWKETRSRSVGSSATCESRVESL